MTNLNSVTALQEEFEFDTCLVTNAIHAGNDNLNSISRVL